MVSYQRAKGLPLTGHVEGATKERLNADLQRVLPPVSPTTATTYSVRGSVRDSLWRGKAGVRSFFEGIGRTGRLVTSAALILFLAFIALATGPGTDLKTLASALGFGILLDATIVRSMLVPALVSMFGHWNWYMPRWLARLLRVPAVAAPTAALGD